MYYLFLSLTITSIIAQTIHSYFVFNSFSQLTGWLRDLQSITFCGIISVAIFGFVYIGKLELALFGAGIEAVINLYYYSLNFWQRQNGRFSWRKQWIALFFGLLIPAMIFIFAEQMIELKP